MSALVVVDPDDPTPPFEQVRRQLADLIAVGRLAAGDRVPPLRQLAGDLGLAVGTVARAYRELEAAGLLESRRGGGTRVTRSARPVTDDRRTRIDELAASYVARARALGADDRVVGEAVQRLLG
ncbi:GntR family transcriptional regulator [uncultured Nocardioides sp.]|uniref:GntR family transcriptional regulator n=1 Tax=uncultured Nocardioides sp. TaxID=198441 RepID=UPI0025F461E6|nr:GntR family transcriptional regulator [uncultured Nocardioides sp.]